MTKDSFEGNASEPTTIHGYQYAGANPISFADGTGHCSDPASLFPGLHGKRICINQFIPFNFGSNLSKFYQPPFLDIIGLLFQGDARDDARGDGGSFRTAQYIMLEPDGNVDWTYRLGQSAFQVINLGATAALAHTDVSRCGAQCVEASMAASDGWFFGAAPNLSYDLKIATFNLLQGVVGSRKDFPSLKVWLYEDDRAPALLYFYDASSVSLNDIFHTHYVNFGEGAGLRARPIMTGGYSGGAASSSWTGGF